MIVTQSMRQKETDLNSKVQSLMMQRNSDKQKSYTELAQAKKTHEFNTANPS